MESVHKNIQLIYTKKRFLQVLSLKNLPVDNRIVDHLGKRDLFRYGFRSSQSTAHLLTVVSDKIARAFSRSKATRAVAHDTSKPFNRV